MQIIKITDLNQSEIRDLLNELYEKYNKPDFIEADPISIPHSFKRKEDIEISGFLTALLSWGQRKQIVKNASGLMKLMDCSPYQFVTNASKSELMHLNKFYYRTFKSEDLLFVVKALRKMYSSNGGLENFLSSAYKKSGDIKSVLVCLFDFFHSVPHQERSIKHIANVSKGSSAKRLNMFLRWMVRNDNRGVDFGLWKNIAVSDLFIPLDVHSGSTARELNLLKRKQNDWNAVEELTSKLRKFDVNDPVKYDFALFGAGINSTR